MKKTLRVVLVVLFCLSLATGAQADDKVRPSDPNKDRIDIEAASSAQGKTRYLPDNLFDGDSQGATHRVTVTTESVGGISTLASGTCSVTFTSSDETNFLKVVARNMVCTLGAKPSAIHVVFFDSNVNSGSTWNERKDSTQHCYWLNGYCSGTYTFTSHRVYRTSYVKAMTDMTANGRTSAPGVSQAYPYNDRGAPYPKVQDTRSTRAGTWVPFRKPAAGWLSCEDDPRRLDNCPRPSSFAVRTRAYYQQNGLTFPANPFEAHHITPLEFGGGNRVPDNSVLLYLPEHQRFNFWWSGFNPRPQW